MRSLLDGVTAADIRSEPFPHVVITDAMEPDLYADLAGSFPGFARIAWAGPAHAIPSNRHFAMSARHILTAPDLPDSWKRFTERHSGAEFLAEVGALFAGHWPAALLAALDGRFTGHSLGHFSPGGTEPGETVPRIRVDARMEINSPVRDRASVVRGPHLDTPNRLYSGLFYMRAPEDDSVGGELVLYRWRGEPVATITAHQLPDEAVVEVLRLPYRANQLVLFPQGIHALHGVGLRQPTPHLRRYVFITAELDRDWLARPGQVAAA